MNYDMFSDPNTLYDESIESLMIKIKKMELENDELRTMISEFQEIAICDVPAAINEKDRDDIIRCFLYKMNNMEVEYDKLQSMINELYQVIDESKTSEEIKVTFDAVNNLSEK